MEIFQPIIAHTLHHIPSPFSHLTPTHAYAHQYSCVVSMTNEEPTALQWAFRAGAPRVFAKVGGEDDDDEAAAAEEKEIVDPEIGVRYGGRVFLVQIREAVGE